MHPAGIRTCFVVGVSPQLTCNKLHLPCSRAILSNRLGSVRGLAMNDVRPARMACTHIYNRHGLPLKLPQAPESGPIPGTHRQVQAVLLERGVSLSPAQLEAFLEGRSVFVSYDRLDRALQICTQNLGCRCGRAARGKCLQGAGAQGQFGMPFKVSSTRGDPNRAGPQPAGESKVGGFNSHLGSCGRSSTRPKSQLNSLDPLSTADVGYQHRWHW